MQREFYLMEDKRVQWKLGENSCTTDDHVQSHYRVSSGHVVIME